MLIGGIAGDVHVAGVPLISECRNGVDTPVEKDAELRVAKPVGCAVYGKRIPCGVKEDVWVGKACFCADFRYLMGGVGESAWHGRSLCRARGSSEEDKGTDKKRFHGDTITEAGVVL